MIERTTSTTSKLETVNKIEVNCNELSDDELRASLEEVTRINRMLTIENDVIEQFLRRKHPQKLEKLALIVESARQAQKISPLRASIGSSHVSLSGKSASTSGSQQLSVGASVSPTVTTAKGLKLTPAHRIELVNKEMELMRKEYDSFEKEIKRKKTSIEIDLEELKYRTKDSSEAITSFEAEVVKQADPITKRISMYKFLRFFEEQSKLAQAVYDKMNLKMITTKRLISQTKKQIIVREEMGKTLRPIDFEQVKIENELLMDENEKNNRTLNHLKRIKRHHTLTLKYHKEALFKRKASLQAIENELTLKKRESIDLRHKQTGVKREVKKVLGQLNDIKELKENYEKPEVADFLQVQRQLQEEQKKYKRLKRRRKIQLFTLKPKRKN